MMSVLALSGTFFEKDVSVTVTQFIQFLFLFGYGYWCQFNFLWQLTSAGDVVTFECFKRSGSNLFVSKVLPFDVEVFALTTFLADVSFCPLFGSFH